MTTPKVEGKRNVWKVNFCDVLAAGVAPEFTIVKKDPGISVFQANGLLNVSMGTTINEEVILRSNETFRGSLLLSAFVLHATRSANSNFFIELVDLVGEAVPFTMLSATQVQLTFPKQEQWMSSAAVGKSVNLGNFVGLSGCIPGRYVIASVVGSVVVLTVSGFPAAGSGTMDVFGMDSLRVLYDGTTATTVKMGASAMGWATGDTTIAVNTSASSGHLISALFEKNGLTFMDNLPTSNVSTIGFRQRGNIVVNVPNPFKEYVLQLRGFNGTTAPTAATVQLGFVQIEDYSTEDVMIAGMKPGSNLGTMPVSLVDVGQGGSSNVVVVGAAAHDSVVSGNPVRVAGRALTANYTAVATGDTADLVTTLNGAAVNKPYSIPELDWSYAAAAGGIVNTTDVAVKAAAGAGIRNYMTSFQFRNANATATEIVIKDGATVIWRGYASASMTAPEDVVLNTPLKSTANAALNVACITTGAQVYFNAQGYSAA